MEGILSSGNLTGAINSDQRLAGTANGKQKLAGNAIPRGNDGFSPIIDIAQIEGGTRVTITDIKGTKYFDVFGGISKEQIEELIREHLENNPPEFEESDPTVPAWAKQATKPKYTAEEVGALPADSLQPAINAALAQAKASGEFKGEPGDAYVLTEADKTEIAEQTAEMVEIPECDAVKTVNGVTPDENGDVTVSAMPNDLEQITILVDTDMLPAIHDVDGAILTDENGNVILRY